MNKVLIKNVVCINLLVVLAGHTLCEAGRSSLPSQQLPPNYLIYRNLSNYALTLGFTEDGSDNLESIRDIVFNVVSIGRAGHFIFGRNHDGFFIFSEGATMSPSFYPDEKEWYAALSKLGFQDAPTLVSAASLAVPVTLGGTKRGRRITFHWTNAAVLLAVIWFILLGMKFPRRRTRVVVSLVSGFIFNGVFEDYFGEGGGPAFFGYLAYPIAAVAISGIAALIKRRLVYHRWEF